MAALPDTFMVTQSHTMTLAHVAMVQDLAARLGLSKSKVVQAAVEYYFDSNPQPTIRNIPTGADQPAATSE